MTQWINGVWLPGAGEYFVKTNPVTGEVIWQGNCADRRQVESACATASAAFPLWARRPYAERQQQVEDYRQQLENHRQQLIETIAQETAKPRWEAAGEVTAMINKIAISIEAYHTRTGSSYSPNPEGATSLRHRPHGALAVFGPYNFPGHLPNGHIVPALLAGNTVVFKPSELTPATAQLMMTCWEKAGLPAGVINLLQGAAETGRRLAEQPLIEGILFTGSAATGHQLHRQLAGHPEKILALEMGGNNALIVEDYDDLDGAVHTVIQSAFISAGQRCTCARRLLVKQGASGDAVVQRLIEVAGRIHPGAWDANPPPFMGGLISQAALQQVISAWHQHIARGAQPLLMPYQVAPESSLLTPGIIEVTGLRDTPDEEIFGPLLTVERYNDFSQAIEIANRTRYGLACGLISGDRQKFDQLVMEARAGIVNWNRPLTGAASNAPFGGIGASGNHRPSAWYAADYCAWPMASMESSQASLPSTLSPGLDFSQPRSK